MSDLLERLRQANINRQKQWDPDKVITASYRSNEMQSEAGEAGNVVKKLERAKLGLRGKTDTVAHLAEELADTIICADLLAEMYDINLPEAIVAKFNATSIANGMRERLT